MGLFSGEKKRLKKLEKIADEVLALEDKYKRYFSCPNKYTEREIK
jgi:hypothetical protein